MLIYRKKRFKKKNTFFNKIRTDLKVYMLIFFIFISTEDTQNIKLENEELIKQRISVAYCLDNNYIYPTLVSMISALENSSNYTFYTFHLLVKKNIFKKENIEKFMHLEEKYNRCKINIFNITNEYFSNANTNNKPISTYYRLLLANLVFDEDRIIYLDGDTLVLDDLTEMINLEMNNSIIMGFVDDSYKLAELYGVKTYKYVTAGVLLINLKEMRKENITQKFFEFMDNNRKNLVQQDQTVINVVLHGRIGLLPPKFGIWNQFNRESALYHNHYKNKALGIQAYSDEEILKALQQPSIVHYVGKKPWTKEASLYKFFNKKWWDYANKSDEFKNILKFTRRKIYM